MQPAQWSLGVLEQSHSWLFLIDPRSGDTYTLDSFSSLDDDTKSCLMLGFVDTCPLQIAPGWMLRNFLVMVQTRWSDWLRSRGGNISILCFRERVNDAIVKELAGESGDEAWVKAVLGGGSIVLRLHLPPLDDGTEAIELSGDGSPASIMGWEPNAKGKMGPRLAELSHRLDPTKLAAEATDLNLKLMRWRALPELDVQLLRRTRCLLVGAGTLGCSVSRCLIGWGFRHITFVDNGVVSYSNPVRQSLYTFEDCAERKLKAPTAAAALKRICPDAISEGHKITIPMPGHAASPGAATEQVVSAVEKLEKLFDEHDVVFILTDTRESRWLPTLLGTSRDLIVMNAALGFDSFRNAPWRRIKQHADRLGCYFCNDVVGPQDSTRDRTLDQQCTVTRPGLAPGQHLLLLNFSWGFCTIR